MSCNSDRRALLERFARENRLAQSEVMLAIERIVLGCDYGGTSYTTRAEADQVGRLLGLGPGKRLLDIGAGSGWPGLYLAGTTGCDLALADVPLEGLRVAVERAAADRLPGACWAIVADGAALPFRHGWFDAIGHSDVLCCLEAKLSVLESCRRVIRTDGRMIFTVISISPDLSSADYQRAKEAGPPCVESAIAYPAMLERAGWKIIDCFDVTAEYAETTRLLVREEQAHANELSTLLGNSELSEKLARRRARIKMLEEGLLRREMFAATAAPAWRMA